MSTPERQAERAGKYVGVYECNDVLPTYTAGEFIIALTRPYGGFEIRCQGFEFGFDDGRGVVFKPGLKYRITVEEIKE